MEIMYIANEGFLIRSGNTKILIDALFGKFESDWCDVPSAEMVEKMETATEPFDDIDLILITHAHVDHFNAEIVTEHLLRNEAALLICPQQVTQALEKMTSYEIFSDRVKEITPEYEVGSQNIDVKGMSIKVWRLRHAAYFIESEETGQMYNKHENVQNLGFTIAIDHKTIFHGGDWGYDGTGESTSPLEAEIIDVAFLGPGAYLRLYDPSNRVTDWSRKPSNSILMHLYPAGNLEELTEQQKNAVSETTVFKSPTEVKSFGD